MEANTRIEVKGVKPVTSEEWKDCVRGLFFVLSYAELFDFKNYGYIELHKNNNHRANSIHCRFLRALGRRF